MKNKKSSNSQYKHFSRDEIFPIFPPYWNCPKCSKQDFGVSMIYDSLYIRECKSCHHSQKIHLPPLDKKIIYLDQFVVSNILKHNKFQKDTPIKKEVFNKLNRLSRLQLISCPHSEFHIDESLLTENYHIKDFSKSLRDTYTVMSSNVCFPDKYTIQSRQLFEHAKNWLNNKPEKPLTLDIHKLIKREINRWEDHFVISANTDYSSFINNIKKTRNKIHNGLYQVTERWKKEKKKTFDDWYLEEVMAFGQTALQIYFNYLAEMVKLRISPPNPDDINPDIFSPPHSVLLIQDLINLFLENNIDESKIPKKIGEYLQSPLLKNIPFNHISSLLYAAIAQKFAHGGHKKPLNKGTATDIDIISYLLPYCDAMFIDKEFHGYLNEEKNKINFDTKIFSINNQEEFLIYLDQIEKDAPNNIVKKAKEVYGIE